MAKQNLTQYSANEYFSSNDNSAYELGNLLQSLPENYRTANLSDDQLKIVEATFLHAKKAKYILLEGIDGIGEVLSNISNANEDSGNEQHTYLSRSIISKLGKLLRYLAGENLFLWQLEETLLTVLNRHAKC